MSKLKKLLCALLVICALLPLFPTTVFAASTIASGDCSYFPWRDDVSWKLDSNYTLTISGTGEMDSFYSESDIPWYSYRKQIKKVVVKDGVTAIGSDAFKNCVALTDVRIGNDVLEINSGAFEGCTALKKFTIPDNVVTLGFYIFENCTALKEVIIGDSIAELDTSIFENCFALKSITIPDSVTYIGHFEFQDCKNLETVFYSGTRSQRESMVIGEYDNDNLEYAAWHYKAGAGEHSNKTTSITAKATTSANGKKAVKCTVCGKKSSKTIYKISSVELSSTAYTYNGSKRTPSVTVKDSKGNKLVKGEDYKLTYSSSKRTAVGRYSVKVTFMGEYKGTKTLYYTINPKNPSTVKAKLYGYDDVKVSWSKVSGASGYRVYYKKNSADSWNYKTTTGTSMKIANLSDGVKYNVKVVAYKTVNDSKYLSSGKTVNITTLKKVNGVKVVKSGKNVKVSWNNIAGETGYQISRSTSKTGTNIVSTYGTTSGNYKNISATEGKTYYYKVRAYKVVDGKKIYGPWSDVVKYTISHTHSYNSNYMCTGCGAIDKAHAYEYLTEWVKDNGVPRGTCVEVIDSQDGMNYMLSYNAQAGALSIDVYNPYDEDDTYAWVWLDDYGYGCEYRNYNMGGRIDPDTYTDNSPITYTSTNTLTESSRSTMEEMSQSSVSKLIQWLDNYLDDNNLGITLADLGFTAY